MLLSFHIHLDDVSNPEVWRKITVPANFSFARFHMVIQAAFGWHNSHLYQFSEEGWGSLVSIGLPIGDDDNEIKDSKKVKLSDVFKKKGQPYVYIYDSGDDWQHSLLLEAITEGTATKATCTDGAGQCPPEDCGGFPGYEDFKKIMANPKHPEYKEMKEWLGLSKNAKWNPAAFNLAAANKAVQSI